MSSMPSALQFLSNFVAAFLCLIPFFLTGCSKSEPDDLLLGITSPAKCTSGNQGRCDCNEGFETYTWEINKEQRCYSTYAPKNNTEHARKRMKGEKLPVLFYVNCYMADRLDKKKLRPALDAADRFGMYIVYVSSPRKSWSWRSAISNENLPMPCDEVGGGDDVTYFGDVFTHLSSSLPDHDPEQVFLMGFSQNGMASGYIGTCFQNKVTGVFRGGAGLYVKGGEAGPMPPGGECKDDNCMFWPAYPCFQGVGKQPLRDCAMVYDNDKVTASNSNFNHAMGLYSKGMLEGGDVRALIFKGDVGGIKGGHTGPENLFDWAVGCMGLRNQEGQCGTKCTVALKRCVDAGQKYGPCIREDAAVGAACQAGCTPTYGMLTQSQVPALYTTNVNGFGTPSEGACKAKSPATSICTVGEGNVQSVTAKQCRSSTASSTPTPMPTSMPTLVPTPAPMLGNSTGMV